VGTSWENLPAWISNWSKVDPSLMSVVDMNRDGVLQLGEMKIGADIVVLATPEIGGLPYVVSALVAAGGLAAALSTADGLLLTIANAIGHDFYYKIVRKGQGSSHRVTVSKVVLLIVALAASALAASKPVDIVFLVSAAFSVAASAFFPALVLGVFWSRANKYGAIAGMLAGLGLTVYYMVRNEPWLRGIFHIHSSTDLWWNIQPISGGVFGVPLGLAVMVVVSLLTPAPQPAEKAFVKNLRIPGAG
jgi:cation/acetate symporter